MTTHSHACPICGSTTYSPGPLGRMTKSGLPPRCEGCGSLERHRIVRQVYDAIPDEFLLGKAVLQFSDDPGAPRERFGPVEISIYGQSNSLDMADIDRGDSSYDWVIANHVLEHVEDHNAAIREMLRVLTPGGVVQITVPTPSTALETWDLPDPDKTNFGHWRGYGSDLPLQLADSLEGALGLQVIGTDAATDRWDVVYLFMKSPETMRSLGGALLRSGLPTLRCA